MTQFDVTDGLLDVFVDRISRVDHDTVDELHGLSTLTTQLSRHNDLASLGLRLHDEAENTVAGTANGQTSAQLEAQRLALSNSAQSAVGNLLGVQLKVENVTN